MAKKSLVFVLNKDNSDEYLNWVDLKSSKYDIVYVEEVLKNKWKTIHDLLSRSKYKLFYYDFPCFINSDVASSDEDLCKFIEVFKTNKLNIASPAIQGPEVFFESKNSFLRNVNYVPSVFFAFSKHAISLFKKNNILNFNDSGSGIDWTLPAIIKNDKVCIIDSIKINYKFEQQEKNIKDFVEIYTEFNLESFYFTEYSRVDCEEEMDIESFSNNFKKLRNCNFRRPTRRSNDCAPERSFISQRLLNATGAQNLNQANAASSTNALVSATEEEGNEEI